MIEGEYLEQYFEFFLDKKETVWNRERILIQAESYEQARVQALLIAQGLKDYDVDEYECLYDTAETLTVEQNGGSATQELIYGYGGHPKTLWDNAVGIHSNEEELGKNT